ncbi:hypothetical protein GGI03_005399 [Coemansia sp. RSA 2337]|nr:hypothetical protein GGI08_000083 [Coemansia sp. S2]KAJ2459997.1 hypothetical protein GGI03_005399 [Coemansia sp. RSA 2337]
MTGAATLVDFNSNSDDPRCPFPDNIILSLLHRWLISATRYIGKQPIGLFAFFLAAFTALASLSVFNHTHSQLAALRRPLRWSTTLLSSMTFAATGSALALALAMIATYRNHGQ